MAEKDVFKKKTQFDEQIQFVGASITGLTGDRFANSAIGLAFTELFSFTNGTALATSFDATETDPATISAFCYTIAKGLEAQGLFGKK
jgi:hypothetical protein